MEPYIGQIMLFAGNFAPVGWASCNGQLLPISSNEALYTLLGTTYGGNGNTTFGLPDLRERIPTHSGKGAGLTNVVLGTPYGIAENRLTIPQIAMHTHATTGSVTISASSGNDEDSDSPIGSYLRATPGVSTYSSSADTKMGNCSLTLTVGTAGTGIDTVPNEQPTMAMNYCIATLGVFPSQG